VLLHALSEIHSPFFCCMRRYQARHVSIVFVNVMRRQFRPIKPVELVALLTDSAIALAILMLTCFMYAPASGASTGMTAGPPSLDCAPMSAALGSVCVVEGSVYFCIFDQVVVSRASITRGIPSFSRSCHPSCVSADCLSELHTLTSSWIHVVYKDILKAIV
jgi:hypothetical protein